MLQYTDKREMSHTDVMGFTAHAFRPQSDNFVQYTMTRTEP